ncbi:MAG: hypothetical protein ACPHCI_02840, partial [Solirubrobacterales bacterium]
ERLAELLGDDAIEITRSEPETTIEWQGESANGTIEISASGWGTKVRLTAETAATQPPTPVAAPEPQTVDEVEPEPEPECEPEPEPGPEHKPEHKTEHDAKFGFVARVKAMFSSNSTAPAEVLEARDTAPGRDVSQAAEPADELVIDDTPDLAAEPLTEAHPEPIEAAESNEIVESIEPAQSVDFETRLAAVLDHLGSAHKRPFVHND